jgi:hypothetical protein
MINGKKMSFLIYKYMANFEMFLWSILSCTNHEIVGCDTCIEYILDILYLGQFFRKLVTKLRNYK